MNELAKIDPHSNVDAYRASTEAAALCKEIVVATSSNIQGRRYVSVEGWQAIARAHGCAAGACEVARVDGGVRATGEVRDLLTGALVARAEGFVGEDEPTWFGGISKSGRTKGQTLPKRDDYAIRAMAQTRAMSRACRSAFAHVVVMMNAGLATTPAEEVPAEGFDRETGEIIEAQPAREKVPGIHKIKSAIREMKALGEEADTYERFEAAIASYGGEMAALEKAQHSWWTGDDGDGNLFEGIPAWVARRRAELTAEPMPGEHGSVSFQLLMSTLAEVETPAELQNWLGRHGDVVEQLDGEVSRRFTASYKAKEIELHAPREQSVLEAG